MIKIVHLGRVLLALGLAYGLSAQALTLGRLSVLSFLGQPLIAEIEVPEISQDESNSLRVAIASAEAFKSAGLDYTPTVAELTITGKRRADGRAILEVRGNQPVTAPFLDLVLDITWNAGRMVRDYTVLLDPPAAPNQALTVPAPTLPMLSSASTPTPLASPVVTTPAAGFTVRTQAEELALRAKQVPPAKSKPTAKNSLKTKKGDTAAALAMANQPEGVSLDQMLVAMLRSNPQAFVDGNVNRLKAGVVMQMPTTEEAAAVKAQEAKNSIRAQARDFNEYRKKLATNASANLDTEASRSASGKVVAKVQDKQGPAPSDDRLTLAKPAQAAQTGKVNAAEEKIAKDRAAADALARSAEINKNISDLGKLAGVKPPVPPVPAVAPSIAPPVTSPASSPAAPTSAPVVAVPQPVRPPVVRPAPEQSLLDQALMNPMALPAAGVAGLLLLLGALFAVRRRRRARDFSATQDTAADFSPTRQPPTDTIFGPMGASEVDTRETAETQMHASSTMVYPPSQLSTVTGDVDPIAEADVYLAYNRDVQAEEILKEAKHNSPKRTDVQLKLLEIYAKRQDVDAFDTAAQELHQLTQGAGDDWSKARVLARDIGSAHPLFKVAGSAFAVADAMPANQSAYSANSLSFVPNPATVSLPTSGASVIPEPQAGSGLIDFDLSALSLDLPTEPTQNMQPMHFAQPEDPKLGLAEEYLSIGDKAGARALIEEVIQHNTDPQVIAMAQQMLMRIG